MALCIHSYLVSLMIIDLFKILLENEPVVLSSNIHNYLYYLYCF